MEPKSHEQMPSPIETTPIPATTTEQLKGDNSEKLGPSIEQAPQPQGSTVSPAIQLPSPVVAVPVQLTNPSVVVAADDDNPQVAADDDLIEKEWVDKAKKIITETKDDPHAREQKVGRLQIDYLKKRYGKELGNQEQG